MRDSEWYHEAQQYQGTADDAPAGPVTDEQVRWLDALIAEFEIFYEPMRGIDDDPDAVNEMLRECRALADQLRPAARRECFHCGGVIEGDACRFCKYPTTGDVSGGEYVNPVDDSTIPF